MKYISLNDKAPKVGFREAVFNGLAPDRGLYFPETIMPLPNLFFETIQDLTPEEIGYQALKQFVGDAIPEMALREIISDTLSFDFPLVAIEKRTYALELFHGPTLAFKDVGARFMARCLAYFNSKTKISNSTVLVATSGDTGGAVANGFLDTPGIEVVILYPSGKVSEIQEKQLTTLGKNTNALEVKGDFDACQEMVKKAFLDPGLAHRKLTSANSINVARWLPQMLYFFLAYKNLKSKGEASNVVFSIPCGNFGNCCAGMMAAQLGLPVSHFIAATNSNDTVPRFTVSGKYEPGVTIPTISNAMDVSNPSNFIRILKLYENKIQLLQQSFSSYSFSDTETLQAMQELYKKSGYIADPHGAIGYLGLKKYNGDNDYTGVFLETAHPIKFKETVEAILSEKLEVPAQIQELLDKKKQSHTIAGYEDLKSFLLGNSNG
ncbi:threonine synthase [Flavobacterium kingsejongi]|uniref:Threonine synthase n=1 Tax=Flavobacterium kingsejongi TaxID=1678728 RepID=A0A2S1LRQ3_9FLAO|nr:threonine synthase [Flavobacterium kingsejongi]AWG26341.1 threonine synthase [Flavobacterium kingsejongi]